MGYPANPVGTCPACSRQDMPLGKSKHLEAGVRVCKFCKDAAYKAASKEKAGGAPSPARAEKKSAAAAPAKKPGPAAKPAPKLTAPMLAALAQRAVVLRVTCHTLDAIHDIVAAAQARDASVQLELAPC